jgi:hypothetical protein
VLGRAMLALADHRGSREHDRAATAG